MDKKSKKACLSHCSNASRNGVALLEGPVSKVGRELMTSAFILIMAGAMAVRSGEVSVRAGSNPADTFAREMTFVHNAIRAEANLPELQWSNDLAAFSQKWADTLLTGNLTMHNPNSPYGENIFITGPGATPSKVVMEWASESQYYRYRTNSCSGDCGHYTQIVWRATRRFGCAVANNDRRSVWVCSYDPPGNYVNEWPY